MSKFLKAAMEEAGFCQSVPANVVECDLFEYNQSIEKLDDLFSVNDTIENAVTSLESMALSTQGRSINEDSMSFINVALESILRPIYNDFATHAVSVESTEDVDRHIDSHLDKLAIAQEGILEDIGQSFREFFGLNDAKHAKLVNELEVIVKEYSAGSEARKIKAMNRITFDGSNSFASAIQGYKDLLSIQNNIIAKVEPAIEKYLLGKIDVVRKLYKVSMTVKENGARLFFFLLSIVLHIYANKANIALDENELEKFALGEQATREIKSIFRKLEKVNEDFFELMSQEYGNVRPMIGGKAIYFYQEKNSSGKYILKLDVYDYSSKQSEALVKPATLSEAETILKLAKQFTPVYRTNALQSERFTKLSKDYVDTITESGTKFGEKSFITRRANSARNEIFDFYEPITRLSRLSNFVLDNLIDALKASK